MGVNIPILKCNTCYMLSIMDGVRVVDLDTIAIRFEKEIKVIMQGKKIESLSYKSITEQTLDIWSLYPNTKPDDVVISECRTCYNLEFVLDQVEDMGSVIIGGYVIDKCYPVYGTSKFYPSIEMRIKRR